MSETAEKEQRMMQSPIDLAMGDVSRDPPKNRVEFMGYRQSKAHAIDSKHAFQVNWDAREQPCLKVDAKEYRVVQFHFHTPSEHTLDKKSYAMEMHLVHTNDEGKLAVVGVFFKVGQKNEFLDQFWHAIPCVRGSNNSYDIGMVSLDLLGLDQSNWLQYSGSLTTPPFTEDVCWIVMEDVKEMSAEQLQFLSAKYPDNARDIQPSNSRITYRVLNLRIAAAASR